MADTADANSNKDAHRHPLIAGGVATAVVGLLAEMQRRWGFVGGMAFVEASIALVLIWMYPERRVLPWTWRSATALVLAGVVLSLLWILSVELLQLPVVFPTWSSFPARHIVAGFVGAAIVTPIFEEKLVRDLLLRGIKDVLRGLREGVGMLVASLLVSIVFALPHSGSRPFAFVVSMVLCWLAIRWRANSFQRAWVHGTVNLMIYFWYFTGGFSMR